MRYTQWAEHDPETRRPLVVDGGQGSYSIRRNTLELRYDNGPVARFLIVVPPGDRASPPETVYVNESRLPRLP